MTVGTSSISPDMSLLQTAYEIGRYIHEHVETDAFPDKRKPWASYDSFQNGPDFLFYQTREGLVLGTTHEGVPTSIHTPYGKWSILDSYSGAFDKVMEAIKVPLGLKLLERMAGKPGLLYAITKWKDRTIEGPVYCAWGDRKTHEAVSEAWNAFAADHESSNEC